MPLPLTYIAPSGYIGLALEATKGTPVAATSWVQIESDTLELDPAIIQEKLVRASLDEAFVPVVGAQKITGNIAKPLFLDQGTLLLASLVGSDAYQTSSAAGTAVSIGASGSGLAAGSSAITVTTQTSTPIAANDYVLIEQGATPGPTVLSEIHKVTSVTGVGPYVITFTSPEVLANTYTTAGLIARIPAGTTTFTHNLLPDIPNANSYSTLTVEKALSNLASLQFAGVTVTKGAFAFTDKAAAKVTYDLTGLGAAKPSQSTPVFGTSAPLALANLAVSLFGSSDNSVTAFSFDLDRQAKEYWTFNSINLPSAIPPTARKITGKWTNLVQSTAYYDNAKAGTTGAAVATLTQGTNSLVVTFPKIVITKLGVPLKVAEALMFDVAFQADYDDVSGHSVAMALINTAYLKIC